MLELIPEKIWIKNREHKVEMAKRFHLLQEDTYQFCVEENLEYLFRPKKRRKSKRTMIRRSS